jgi:hypothetical protein
MYSCGADAFSRLCCLQQMVSNLKGSEQQPVQQLVLCPPAGIMNHPWFLTALPREALAMNSRFLAAPRACSQSEEDIWRVIRTVRRHAHAVDSLQGSVLLAPSLSPGTWMVM